MSATQELYDAKQFSRTLKLTTCMGCEGTFAALSAVGEVDQQHERGQQRWLGVAIACAIATFASLFFLSFSPLLALLSAVLLAGTFLSLFKYTRHRRLNISNRRYEIVRSLVRHLSCDIAPDAPIELEIDFNSYHNNRYRTSHESSGIFSSTSLSTYEIPWLTLKGSLLDGNRFRIGVTQLIKRKSQAKRKYTKVKEVFREKIDFMLAVRTKRYGKLQRLADIQKRLPAPEDLTYRSVSVSGNRLHVQAMTQRLSRIKGRHGTSGENAPDKTSDQHTLLGLFLRSYQALAESREPNQ